MKGLFDFKIECDDLVLKGKKKTIKQIKDELDLVEGKLG